MRAVIVTIAILLGVTSPALGQNDSGLPRRGMPWPAAVSIQVVAGGLGAVAGGAALGWLGIAALGPHGGEDPGLMGAVVGASVGIVLGSSLGVNLAASLQGYRGGYPAAFGGASLGLLALIPLSSVVRLDADNPSFWAAALGLPVAGAVLATALADHWRRGVSGRFVPHVVPAPGGVRVGLRAFF